MTNKKLPTKRSIVLAGSAMVTTLVLYCLLYAHCSLLTPDQEGHRLFTAKHYQEASQHFTDPLWKAAALFKEGEFKEAAGLFAGFDTAMGAFNHGNSLVMQGKYAEAVARYNRALELHPGWEDAEINRTIARGRAEALEKKGGNMTGGKLGADEIVFSKGKSSPEAENEQTEGGQEVSDAELRQVWLRKVQTRPADFLRTKFAYQYQFSNTPATNKKGE